MQCGLLGRTLGHSYSPQIHRMLADYDYRLYEVEPDNLAVFLQSACYSGLNVTIPYKKAVIPYCDTLSDTANRLGAVNTLVRRDGKLIGHNSDYFGFLSMVQQCGVSPSGKKALVLGSGGASATAVAVLEELGAKTVVISRSGSDNYNNLEHHADAAVIVNATPVGMYPNTDKSPVDISMFTKLECVLDLIYNPSNTILLQEAQKRNIPNRNGLWMLVAQAKESAEWFTGESIPDTVIAQIYRHIQKQTENVILVGMPGCGKSTIGKLLAQKLGRTFIDADEAVIAYGGKSIPEIFSEVGEDGFRALETKVLSEIGKRSGTVIATGGGCVTRPENYPLLHQNGRIIWVKRHIDALPTDGRPLSLANKPAELYAKRKPLYDAFCDFSVNNDQDIANTVTQIINYLQKEDSQ